MMEDLRSRIKYHENNESFSRGGDMDLVLFERLNRMGHDTGEVYEIKKKN
jgi:hypothetical protein